MTTQKPSDKQGYCYECGNPWPKEHLVCLSCGSSLRENENARPMRASKDDAIRYPWPWNNLPWPPQGSVGLIGGPGSGKSSLAALIKPKVWLSIEMEPKLIGNIVRRITPDHMPLIRMVRNSRDVAEALRDIFEGPVALDSATAMESLGEALAASQVMVSWAKERNDRSLTIVQVNKAGEAAGFMKIPHLFDTTAEVSPEDYGLRTLNYSKSRWAGLDTTYFTFDGKGQISMPPFDAAYSVEGNPGSYTLHPFPMSSAKWAAVLDFLQDSGSLEGGIASAATSASYMKHGFIEPTDVNERKRFAERHGLKWVSARDLLDQETPAGKKS